MTTWQARTEHLAAHFRSGLQMSAWVGDWGFTPGVLAKVENAILPSERAAGKRDEKLVDFNSGNKLDQAEDLGDPLGVVGSLEDLDAMLQDVSFQLPGQAGFGSPVTQSGGQFDPQLYATSSATNLTAPAPFDQFSGPTDGICDRCEEHHMNCNDVKPCVACLLAGQPCLPPSKYWPHCLTNRKKAKELEESRNGFLGT